MATRKSPPAPPKKQRPEPGPRDVIELVLDFLSRHETAGPKLRGMGRTVTVRFTDVGLSLVAGPASGKRLAGGHSLDWEWGRPVKLAPSVEVQLTFELASRFSQGKENIARSLAMGDLDVLGGDASKDRQAVLDALPILVPLQKRCVELLKENGLEAFLV